MQAARRWTPAVENENSAARPRTEAIMNVRRNTERGVTLTELLVVLLIIALLSTIAVPVYLNRAEMARVRTAQTEVREIAMAEDYCAAIHGFYVPLQTLDDIPVAEGTNQGTETDRIDNYGGLNTLLVEPTLPLIPQVNNQYDLSGNSTVVRELILEWQGPFINYNRAFMGTYLDASGVERFVTSELDVTFPEVKADLPLDPWGEPYRIFSPIGITGQGATGDQSDQLEVTDFLGSGFNTTSFFTDFNLTLNDNSSSVKTRSDPYDQWAIVSFGPNRIADEENSDNNDDIFYLFGLVAPESGFTARF
jgi:prepilin-type N-terminal cleavage/methylation domain-containing protein